MRVEPIEGSRVKAIVGNSIMVELKDVKVGDILCVSGDEGDPIIEQIDEHNGSFRFHYRPRGFNERLGCDHVTESSWLNPNEDRSSGHIFVTDLKNERAIHMVDN